MDGNTAISIPDADPQVEAMRAAHGDALLELQLQWEATMWEAGAQAVRDKIDNQFEEGKADQTPGGRAVLFSALASVEAGFDRWLAGGPLVSQLYDEAAATNIVVAKPGKRGPKPNTDHLKYLSRLSAREIASITLRCMIKGLSRNSDDNGLEQIGVRNSIMHAVEAAARRAMFAAEQAGADLLHHMEKDNQRSGYSRKARRERFTKTFDDRFSTWWGQEDLDYTRRLTLAQWLMVGAIENANPRIFERHTYTTEKKLPRTIIVPTEHLLKAMRDRNSHAELHAPLVLPFAIPPRPWISASGGAYWSPGSPRLKLVKGAHRDHMDELTEASDAGDLMVVYGALNAAQDTAWRINGEVYRAAQWVRRHIKHEPHTLSAALMPSFEPIAIPAKPPAEGTKKEIDAWKADAARAFQTNRLEYGRRAQVDAIMSAVDKLENKLLPSGEPLAHAGFYFAYTLDYRGRMYALQNDLQPQGSKFARALLEFAEGVPIMSTEGERWLMIHVANCFGQDKATLEDRVAWMHDPKNSDLVRRIGRSPTETLGLWADVGNVRKFEPWLALRAAIEWAGYQDAGGKPDGSFVSHLPVTLDGTCNGLQHLAKLSGDAKLGKLVNIVGCDEAVRSDVYAAVSDAAQEFLQAEVSNGRDAFERSTTKQAGAAGADDLEDDSGTEDSGDIAEEDAEVLGEVFYGIYGDILQLGLADRSMSKQVVVPIQYGASQRSTIRTIESAILDRIEDGKFGREPPPLWVLDLQKSSRMADSDERRAKRKAARCRLKVLVGRLNDVLWKQARAQTGSAQDLMQWMKAAADRMTEATEDGLPIRWNTPANFPAYLAEHVRVAAPELETRAPELRLRMRHTRETTKMDKNAQRRALAPGFVHSLDAAHMMLTVQSAQDRGVTAFALVHDSFGTHAEAVPMLREALDVAFQRTYAVDPLAGLSEAMVGAIREARGAEFGFGGDGAEPNTPAENALDLPARGELAFDDGPLGPHAFA